MGIVCRLLHHWCGLVCICINKLGNMKDIKDFQLLEYNTFGIEGKCKRFCEFDTVDELRVFLNSFNETDQPEYSIKYLNQVRQRSNAHLMDANPGKNTLRSSIIEERAKELACEGDRRWDLIRWGIYLDAMNAIGGFDDSGINKNRTERNLLYPIPADEISANDAIKENNPGWN